jgi:beta-lactamase superfamily II metal-dependent hydrolase
MRQPAFLATGHTRGPSVPPTYPAVKGVCQTIELPFRDRNLDRDSDAPPYLASPSPLRHRILTSVLVWPMRVHRLEVEAMKIEIHDVDHGGCVLITGPTGDRLMLDCGQSLTRPWFPSITYSGQSISTLMLLNLDEDHVEDLAGVWGTCRIGALASNPTVTASALAAMKDQGMRRGVQTAHDIFAAVGAGFLGNWAHDLGGVRWHAFWNRYLWDFTDTNNLSLAVFVSFGNFTILFGGDLETAGWKRLLAMPDFRRRLHEVNVFVASHHGRENGQCEELFQLCRPELIIFSDGPKEYDTQETVAWYSYRAIGIPDYTQARNYFAPPRRKVMTTRSDGTIQINVDTSGRFTVYREKDLAANIGALAMVLGAPTYAPLGMPLLGR